MSSKQWPSNHYMGCLHNPCVTFSQRAPSTDLRLPLKKSSNGQKSFSYRGAKLWNSHSAESKQASSLYSLNQNLVKLQIGVAI